VTARTPTRTVYRWEHEEVLERHRARMHDARAAALMHRRAALAEHPFGTLKCRAGYRHFLLRGFDKVRGEWSLMALCYNFTRVLSIIGLDGFITYLAKRRARADRAPFWLNRALHRLAKALPASFHEAIAGKPRSPYAAFTPTR
jgi:hypothetical protein